MEKTSLEKSHSKSSNAKLTLLCLITALLLVVFVVTLGYYFKNAENLFLIISLVSAGLSILCFLGFSAFKR